MKYYEKPFKSAIVLNSEDFGGTHFKFDLLNEESNKNIDVEIYPDGVVTSINPVNGFLSLSFDNGNTWINSILNISVKNVKRIDKETFLFYIVNPNNSTSYAVTYDMFMNYDIIPVGTDNDNMRIECNNRIENKPISFVRNSLYVFNEDERSYTKIMTFSSNQCSIHDSIDDHSVCLLISNSSGYSVKKFNKVDRYELTYIDLYNFVVSSGSWINSIMSFNIIKAFDNSDCFVITTTDFSTKIDIPSANIISDVPAASVVMGFSYP